MPSTKARIKRVFREEGSKWFRIELEDSDAGVKRLDTDSPEAATEAARFKEQGGLVLIDYNERPSRNINPHTNQPYIDRYYSKAGPIGNGSVPGVETVATSGKKTDPEDAWRMTLAASAKLAVVTISALPVESRTREVVLDFELQKRIALAWANFLYRTKPEGLQDALVGNGFTNVDDAPREQDWQPPTDDDIPY